MLPLSLRHNSRQGVALITMLLVVTTLITALIAITSIISLRARGSIIKRQAGVYVQHTAESGLSAIHYRDIEMQNALAYLQAPSRLSIFTIEEHARRFCGRGVLLRAPASPETWSSQERQHGFTICHARPISTTERGRLTIFENHIADRAYKDLHITQSPEDYWHTLFSVGATTTSELGQLRDRLLHAESQLYYSPKAVRVLLDGSYRFVFERHTYFASGQLLAKDGGVIAARRLRMNPRYPEFYLEIGRPNFARYTYIRGDGHNLNYSALPIDTYATDQMINGRVHINGGLQLGSLASSFPEPIFKGMFTMVAQERQWDSSVSQEDKIPLEQMFPYGFELGAEPVRFPMDLTGQRLAASGQMVITNEAFDQADACIAFGMLDGCIEGIHYSQSQDTTINQGRFWLGGIYVVGGLNNLIMSIHNGQQKLTLIHANGQHVTFTQDKRKNWVVYDSSKSFTHKLQGEFNGMIFVEGGIYDSSDGAQPLTMGSHGGLQGDGTAQGDIAPDSRLTICATGDIVITTDITYAQDPNEHPSTLNMLGLVGEQNLYLKTDQPDKSFVLHGSYMLINPRKNLHLIFPPKDIVLHTTTILGSLALAHLPVASSANTYTISTTRTMLKLSKKRDDSVKDYGFAFPELRSDPRLLVGMAPPFFPQASQWQRLASPGLRDRSLWQFIRR